MKRIFRPLLRDRATGRRRAPRGRAASVLGVLGAFILGACAASTNPPGPPSGSPSRLFAERRYFELNALLAAEPGNNQTETLFFRGMMANVFNHPEESAAFLNAYLKRAGESAPKERAKVALSAMADDFIKMFQYGLAAETRANLLTLVRADLKPGEIADSERVIRFWKALQGSPPQTVTISEYTLAPIVGRMEVMADLGDLEVALLPDTGSSISLITRADAERLGFNILDAPIQVGTATGEGILARPAIVPEMRIGGVVIRNSLFLVVPERMLYFPEIQRQRSGTVGFPVLNAMKEITLSRSTFTVPVHPSLGGGPDFFLDQTNPVLKVGYAGRRLYFLLDTGGFSSELYPPFFRAFRKDIVKKGIPGLAVVEGVGTQVEIPTYLMGGLTFVLGGHEVNFGRDLVILTKPTSEESDVYDGVFGVDLLSLFSRMTINYESMGFALD
jgi:hypothetical protein